MKLSVLECVLCEGSVRGDPEFVEMIRCFAALQIVKAGLHVEHEFDVVFLALVIVELTLHQYCAALLVGEHIHLVGDGFSLKDFSHLGLVAQLLSILRHEILKVVARGAQFKERAFERVVNRRQRRSLMEQAIGLRVDVLGTHALLECRLELFNNRVAVLGA